MVFVSRCQNLETEHNTTAFAAKNPDGGFYYTPAAGGSSMAGKTDNGGLRSYGSMTYAGPEEHDLLPASKPDDPRVKAAVNWAQQALHAGRKPRHGDAGLYYYYHLFAKALDALGEPQFDRRQRQIARLAQELVAELAKRQQPDGSWVNKDNRWMEGDPNLVTGYALLTLSYCRPPAGK